MIDPSVMPAKLAAFLSAHGGQKATVTTYEPMSGGYSRLMAKAAVT